MAREVQGPHGHFELKKATVFCEKKEQRYFLPYSCLLYRVTPSRAGIGRPGTLCVGAAGRSAAVCCVRGR